MDFALCKRNLGNYRATSTRLLVLPDIAVGYGIAPCGAPV